MDYIALYVGDHWSHKPSYFNPNLELPVLMALFYLLYGGVIRILHVNLFKIYVHIHRDQGPSNFVPRSNSTHLFRFFDYCSKTKKRHHSLTSLFSGATRFPCAPRWVLSPILFCQNFKKRNNPLILLKQILK